MTSCGPLDEILCVLCVLNNLGSENFELLPFSIGISQKRTRMAEDWHFWRLVFLSHKNQEDTLSFKALLRKCHPNIQNWFFYVLDFRPEKTLETICFLSQHPVERKFYWYEVKQRTKEYSLTEIMSIAGPINAQMTPLFTSSQQASDEPYPTAWVAPSDMATITAGKPWKTKIFNSFQTRKSPTLQKTSECYTF